MSQSLGSVVRKALPYVNFAVASTALGFQYFVLYPWHNELDKEFHQLRQEQSMTLEEYHQKKLGRLQDIERKLELHHQRIREQLDREEKLMQERFSTNPHDFEQQITLDGLEPKKKQERTPKKYEDKPATRIMNSEFTQT